MQLCFYLNRMTLICSPSGKTGQNTNKNSTCCTWIFGANDFSAKTFCHITLNRIYNKILDSEFFSVRMSSCDE